MLTDFRNKIPSLALSFPNTDGLVSVLDGMYNYKKSQQDHFFRAYNDALNPYRSALEIYLTDCGFPKFAEPLPMVVLHTMALNAGNIMRYRGSRRGILLFLHSLSLGRVTLQLDDFFPKSLAISPNDLDTGFLPGDPADDAWYVYSADEESLDSSFSAHIETIFNENTSVKRYITSHLVHFLPFFESFFLPKVTFSCGAIRYLEFMPEYFNFNWVASATSYRYYDTLSALFSLGYTVDVSYFYEFVKQIQSDLLTTPQPSFPPTSCTLLEDNYLLVTDNCGILISGVNSAISDDPDIEILNAACLLETITTYCRGTEIAFNGEAPSVSSLDFLIRQAHTL